MKFLSDPKARRTLGLHKVQPLSTTCWSLHICRWDHSHFGGGEGPGGGRAFWGGLRGGLEISIRVRVDVETYFFWHEHNSCAAAILRAFLWFNQATMAVIIFSPPYSFSALHSSRLDSRLVYSRTLPIASRFTAANGFNANVQRRFSSDLVKECDRECDLDLIFDLYSPPSDLDWCDSESGLL
jgi:hypothetical protein